MAAKFALTDLCEVSGQYFFLIYGEKSNGNARATMEFRIVRDLASDTDLLTGYTQAIARWHEVGISDNLPWDEKLLASRLSAALGVPVTSPRLDSSARVTITHEIGNHEIRLTAVRRDDRGREAEQWKACVADDQPAVLAATIRKAAAYAATLEGTPFE